jgi:hypothetical protein
MSVQVVPLYPGLHSYKYMPKSGINSQQLPQNKISKNKFNKVKDLYMKTINHWKRNWHQKIERSPMLIGWQNQYCENDYTTKRNLHVQCNPHQNSSYILHKDRKFNPKIHTEAQMTSNSQSNPGEVLEVSW